MIFNYFHMISITCTVSVILDKCITVLNHKCNVSSLQVLEYVPALAWVQLLEGCPPSHLVPAERFLASLVAREVAMLPKGVYLTATQEAKKNGLKVRG